MTQKISVYGTASYSNVATNQSALNSALSAAHSSGAFSIIYDHDENPTNDWARAWAQANGVPYVPLASRLIAEGYIDPYAAAKRFHDITASDQLITFGTGADVDAVVNTATAKGKKINKN